ncbi:MAG: sensor histidine kinase [Deltaproteobacteria bacterium]|nr:sensor histidine kinase [Deltaproteobacteria bacterium]
MSRFFNKALTVKKNDEGRSPAWYQKLRRNITILMLLVTLLPLSFIAGFNYYVYQGALKNEIMTPLKAMVNKTKHSFELFLTERISAVSFIASAYTFEELADQNTLGRIFRVMKKEFGGFIDLGLINSAGKQVSYAGPYRLEGKEYAGQPWFQEVQLRGTHISDVFMGYRQFPHFVIAVQHVSASGRAWILRVTIDTRKFNELIASMGLDASTDAYILNREGTFQTTSKFYGRVLEKCPNCPPPISYEPTIMETVDDQGREILFTYTDFQSGPFRLVVVSRRSEVLKSWVTFKNEIFYVFVVSVILISIVIIKLTGMLVRRIEESDQKRELAYHEMEYTSKLASIGRLAAGVAHEINNPLAVINEKAGLMKDLMTMEGGVVDMKRFQGLTDGVLTCVERCRAITHRLLGFARRMDVSIEVINLNEVLREVLSFLEREALNRNLVLHLELAEDLPSILSDRGQLQQVFLNILNNAFDAVKDGGQVTIKSLERDPDHVEISISDNGVGMSEETMRHIFEPFFSTKKGYGTGLGLSITYGIVKKLGGEIKVDSRLDKGTVFQVILPKRSEQEGE